MVKNPIKFFAKDVAGIVHHMKRQVPGHDGLCIGYLQLQNLMFVVFSMLYTFWLRHSYLPESLTKTVVVSILTNFTGDTWNN